MKWLKLNRNQWVGILRHVLTFGGGILIAKGLVDESTWSEVSGSVLALVGAIWSISEKY
jgi:hypothetical protein